MSSQSAVLRSPVTRLTVTLAGVLAGSLLAACSLLPPPDVPPVPTGQAVPQEPERVVVLDADVTLEPVLAPGLPVVAAPSPSFTGGFSSTVEPLLDDDFTDLGPLSGLSEEAVAAADPDVIVINPAAGEIAQRYGDLSRIAPVVAPGYEQTAWRQRLLDTAEVFGRTDEAQDLLAEYDARVAEVDALVPDGTTLSMVRVRADGFRYLTSGGSFPWTVLSDVGFEQPSAQDQGAVGEPFVDISLEEADVLRADVRVVSVDGTVNGEADRGSGGAGTLADLEDNPLWADLSEQTHIVPSADWVFGGILSALAILDDVERWYR
jgi:iron complex transport system substrate-binding protein